jgi:hypothetical protein
MKIINRIKFRWKNCCDPLPGEVESTNLNSNLKATIVYQSKGEDAEKNIVLRKMRGLITGYGEGWRFHEALWDWAFPKILVVGGIVLWFLIFKVKFIWMT